MRETTVHVGWGCLGLAAGAGLVLLAVAVQAVLSIGVLVVELIAHG